MKSRKYLMTATMMLLTALCLLAGCQTTVPVSYTDPARLDLNRVNRIAVDSDNSQVAESISKKLTETGKYTVASEAELSEWKRWKTLASRQAQAAEISAADLVGAYAGNAVRADASYQGKTLKITAVVNEIGKSSKGNYFARLTGAGRDSVDVFFAASEISALATVDKGQTITIIGECRGYNPPDLEDTAEILRLLGAGRAITMNDATFPVDDDYPGAVNAVISLNTNSSVQNDSHINKQSAKDSSGKFVLREVVVYDLNVTTDIGYQVVRARDSSLIGEGKKSATSKNSNADRSKLPASADLVTKTIDEALNQFIRDTAPQQREISITLAEESDNKEAQKEMDEAEKLVDAKNYADAAAAYGKIYGKYKNFAAGYNHAVLTEVAEGTAAAVGLMEALFKETGNPAARSTLEGMQSRNASNQRVAAQLSQ
jgi:uncharacterized lipoprotein YajG